MSRICFLLLILFAPLVKASNTITRFPDAVVTGFDWKGFAILAVGFGTSGTYMQHDRNTIISIQNHNGASRAHLDAGETFGTGVPNAVILGVQYFYKPFDGRAHLDGLVYTLATTTLIKEIVNRKRPNGGTHSYPSGHTAAAFTTATNIAYSMGWIGAVIAYPIAALVGYQRMADNYHWPSDVIAGATLGIFWGRAAYINKAFAEEGLYSKFYPVISHEYAGLNFYTEF